MSGFDRLTFDQLTAIGACDKPEVGDPAMCAVEADRAAVRVYGGRGLYYEFGCTPGATWLSTVAPGADGEIECASVTVPTERFKLMVADLIHKDAKFAALVARALAAALTEKNPQE